jgi:hypothetical protein
MPLSENHNMQVNGVGASIPNVSAASVAYAGIPFKGRVVGGGCCISAAISAGSSVITVSKVNVSGVTTIGTITIGVAGAGNTFGMVITGNEQACSVEAFESLKFDNAGGSTGAAIGSLVALVRGG